MQTLNVIVPCYNEEENVRDFYTELRKVAPFFREKDVRIEITYVDDGSTDATSAAVKALHEEDENVHLIRFSRNFGKEAAIYAGLTRTDGDYAVIMDCDLQDPPSLLPGMFTAIREEGYDSVATRRVNRKGEPVIRSFFARRFYRLINRVSGITIVDGARDFRMMTRQFARAITQMKEYNRFSKGIFSWIGFDTKWIEYENIKRNKGETKWSFWKLFVYAIDGIVAFSSAPLAVASVMGIVCFVLAVVFLLVIFVRALIYGDPTPGWPSMVCILLLVSGVQMFFIGVVGQYLAKTYLEVKNRPIYIEKESV
ncbi:MAG: glycosyltransferase family 2 protein [Lachnospiraceae bacterium]|nr:glycosyltransferase family 2 protein [Lachnospiraceae bacterium]